MDVLWALVGAVGAAAVLWEVFDDLFHPSASGALSSSIGRTLFRLFRRTPRVLPVAGPLALVIVITVWVFGLALAFSLMYLGWFPEAFRTSTGDVPPASPRFLSAFYFSLATLTTLGYGDVVPNAMPIRYVASLEGLIGFALLTASVSSIVLLYQALSRMRLLARGVAHIISAEQRSGVRVSDCDSDVLLAGLARDVTHARIDFVHLPLVYYFATNDPDASVARWTRQLVRLAREGSAAGVKDRVRLAACALDGALSDLSELLAERFVEPAGEEREAVFDAFAADHVISRA